MLIGRRFQLWEYYVGHGSLLIRSPKTPDNPTNVDLIFDGTTFISAPRHLNPEPNDSIEIVEPTEREAKELEDLLGIRLREAQLFVLKTQRYRHLIVAAHLTTKEHDGDIFESPFRR